VKTIDQFFSEVSWRSASDIEREYVSQKNPESSPGESCQISFSEIEPRLSVIIPTRDADCGGHFVTLLAQIEAQSLRDFELIVVKGDNRQGRAINIGAALAKGEYLLTLDDDSHLPDDETFAKLIKVMQANTDIGMAGAPNVIPDWASSFVKRVMRQVPRYSSQPVTSITDSDLAEHGCLIIRADAFRQIGGENELMPRGLDPYLRQKFRTAGYRIVIAPDTAYHHLPADGWIKLALRFYRNGKQAAFSNRYFPQWIIETPAHHGDFIERVPLWKRIFRYPLRMLTSLLHGNMIWFMCQCSYAWGFIVGWWQEKKHNG
jgi:glycosyltransferase involved in cell wall biosynthesis